MHTREQHLKIHHGYYCPADTRQYLNLEEHFLNIEIFLCTALITYSKLSFFLAWLDDVKCQLSVEISLLCLAPHYFGNHNFSQLKISSGSFDVFWNNTIQPCHRFTLQAGSNLYYTLSCLQNLKKSKKRRTKKKKIFESKIFILRSSYAYCLIKAGSLASGELSQ